MNQRRCRHCHIIFLPNPRVKDQRYCNRPECQRARKAHWQNRKMHQDPDYQANHHDAQMNWLKRNPGYWKRYRAGHPTYVQANRLKQQNRDRKRRLVHLAKMDPLRPLSYVKPGGYYLIPDLAKMDALTQKVFIIPARYTGGP